MVQQRKVPPAEKQEANAATAAAAKMWWPFVDTAAFTAAVATHREHDII